MGEASEMINAGNAQGKGFAARLTIARKLTQRLHEPTENIYSLGNTFASQLHEIDPGVRAIIEQAPTEVRESPENLKEICSFFHTIRDLSAAAHEGLQAIQDMSDSVSPVEGLSRDLRKPLRRLRRGLTLMFEAREVIMEWVEAIDGADIDCDDVASASSA